jgi:hypothetical protein
VEAFFVIDNNKRILKNAIIKTILKLRSETIRNKLEGRRVGIITEGMRVVVEDEDE